MAKNQAPQVVLDAAKLLVDMYGANFDYLGIFDGADAYVYKFPEDSSTGYPFVYLLKDGKVTEITGAISLHIIELSLKNTGV